MSLKHHQTTRYPPTPGQLKTAAKSRRANQAGAPRKQLGEELALLQTYLACPSRSAQAPPSASLLAKLPEATKRSLEIWTAAEASRVHDAFAGGTSEGLLTKRKKLYLLLSSLNTSPTTKGRKKLAAAKSLLKGQENRMHAAALRATKASAIYCSKKLELVRDMRRVCSYTCTQRGSHIPLIHSTPPERLRSTPRCLLNYSISFSFFSSFWEVSNSTPRELLPPLLGLTGCHHAFLSISLFDSWLIVGPSSSRQSRSRTAGSGSLCCIRALPHRAAAAAASQAAARNRLGALLCFVVLEHPWLVAQNKAKGRSGWRAIWALLLPRKRFDLRGCNARRGRNQKDRAHSPRRTPRCWIQQCWQGRRECKGAERWIQRCCRWCKCRGTAEH